MNLFGSIYSTICVSVFDLVWSCLSSQYRSFSNLFTLCILTENLVIAPRYLKAIKVVISATNHKVVLLRSKKLSMKNDNSVHLKCQRRGKNFPRE